MACPKCGKEMKEITLLENLTLDICTGCKGMWYDKGELGFQQELTKDIPNLPKVEENPTPTMYPCPRCENAKLIELKYHMDEDLLIDRCPGCEGIFLDRGELSKVETIVAKTECFATRLGHAVKDIEDRGFKVSGTSIIKK